ISTEEIEQRFGHEIEARDEVTFDTASAGLRGRKSRRLGAITLAEQPTQISPNEATAQALAAGIARIGVAKLPWTKSLTQWRDRVMFLRRAEGDEWPDLSDAALAETIGTWLAPMLGDKTALGQIGADELTSAVEALVPWNMRKRLDAEAPTHFTAPTGSHVPI